MSFLTKLITITFFLFNSIAVAKNTNKCTEINTSTAYIIKNSGCYKLMQDIFIEDPTVNGIVISANNVKLDLNQHNVTGAQNLNNRAAGIYMQGVNNVSISNGIISKFLYGIRSDLGSKKPFSHNVKVSNIIATQNYFRGISIEAFDSQVINNIIEHTGKTLLFDNAFAIGIEVKGKNCQIIKNKVFGIYPNGIGEGVAISLSSNNDGSIVKDNLLKNNVVKRISFRTFGMWLNGESKVLVLENSIEGFTYPFNIEKGSIYKKNIAKNIACGRKNYNIYYKGLSEDNLMYELSERCPDGVKGRFYEMLFKPNAHTIFRLAQSYYSHHEYECPCEIVKCFNKAAILFRLSGFLGINEAQRVWPLVQPVIEKNKILHQNKCYLQKD